MVVLQLSSIIKFQCEGCEGRSLEDVQQRDNFWGLFSGEICWILSVKIALEIVVARKCQCAALPDGFKRSSF